MKGKAPEDFLALSHRILTCASASQTTLSFVRPVCELLAEFGELDAVEIRLKEGDRCTRHEVTVRPERRVVYEVVPCPFSDDLGVEDPDDPEENLEHLTRDVIFRRFDAHQPFFTANGTFWTEDTGQPFVFTPRFRGRERSYRLGGPDGFRSLAMFPLTGERGMIGLLTWKSRTPHRVSAREIRLYEIVAQNLGLALAHLRTRGELALRVKELTCLFGISQLAGRKDQPLEEILAAIVALVPPALLHTNAAHARLLLDDREVRSPEYREGRQRLRADIVVAGARRGHLEAVYAEDEPELDEGPFLTEERHLIDAVARQIALVVEEQRAQEQRTRLEEQLRHADRLATIGQLASGVAHELAEPLGAVLGFAQLVRKAADLPAPVVTDVEKIVGAALHAREVIKKLTLFARQHPTRSVAVDLSAAVRDGLSFLEARCEAGGIELRREFAEGLPPIQGDPAQVHQVLVNLVVNAIQAMPDGGRLSVGTAAEGAEVLLYCEDSGVGIPREILGDIFLPFFTTKDVREGTGLGLAVVHGIVTTHGGRIHVESEVGRGTRFEIRFPRADRGEGSA